MEIKVYGGGRLVMGDREYRCALGRSGLTMDKREGDGGTPVGRFPLRAVLYREDRLGQPDSCLPTERILDTDGWCDDPSDPQYNRHVNLPYQASAENLHRQDRLYDIIVILGYNDQPVRPGRGSAIFFHIASPDYKPTEGCVAVSHVDMYEILRQVTPQTIMSIGMD